MRWWLATLLLLSLLILAGATTWLNFGHASKQTVAVELGIKQAQSGKGKYLDDAIITAFEVNNIDRELRTRLNKPTREVQLDAIFIDTCEVSQRDYETFLEWEAHGRGVNASELPEEIRSESTGHRVTGRLDSPASGISYQAAANYCQQAGGRLPFAEEYETIGGGLNQRLYPWGNEFNDDAWPYNSALRNSAQSCAAHPNTSTPFGVHDLVNNALEWSQGSIQPSADEPKVAVHGAPALRPKGRALYALNAAWLEITPTVKSHYIGFRCAYDELPPINEWNQRRAPFAHIPKGRYRIGIPTEATLPLFVANMPRIQGLRLGNLLQSVNESKQTITVDRCEVTRAEFQDFLDDPLVRLGLLANNNEPEGVDYEPQDWSEQSQDPTLPVYGVSWWAADAYARWAGGQLPSVDEWRQLATGEDGNRYPWGDIYRSLPTIGDSTTAQLQSCGSTENDQTSVGLNDMGGNLSEWTRSVAYQNGRLSIWVQGGNWLLPGRETAQAVFGRLVPIGHRSGTIGFRVIYD